MELFEEEYENLAKSGRPRDKSLDDLGTNENVNPVK